MHLYTHGIHIPGVPHSDLHAKLSQLESTELIDAINKSFISFWKPPRPQNETQSRQKSKSPPQLQLHHTLHQVLHPQIRRRTPPVFWLDGQHMMIHHKPLSQHAF